MALILAVLAAAVFTIINCRGAAETGRIGSFLTLSKIAILSVLVVFGAKALLNRPNWGTEFVPFLPRGIGGVFTAMGLTAIAFEGYEVVTQSGEEAIDPRRNIPRAIFISIGVVVLVYLAVASVLLGAIDAPNGIPTWQFLGEHAEQAVVEAVDQLIPYGEVLLLIGGVMSALSALNATFYSSSRVSFAMGRNRDLPDIFGHVHPTRHAPQRWSSRSAPSTRRSWPSLATRCSFRSPARHRHACLATLDLQWRRTREARCLPCTLSACRAS